MTPKQKLEALALLFDELKKEFEIRQNNIKLLSHEIRGLVDVNSSELSNEDLLKLKTAAENFYDGPEWASIGASCWQCSRPVSNLLFQRNNNSVSLQTQKAIAKEAKASGVSSRNSSAAIPNIATLSDEDKRKLMEFLKKP